MVFSSIVFLLYFLPFVLLLFLLVPVKGRNMVLLVSSLLFYSWGAPRFAGLLCLSTAVDFFMVHRLFLSSSQAGKKIWLTLTICLNVGILFYFKYCDFFVSALTPVWERFGLHFVPLGIMLPIGISFYTFESITYAVDVYRGVHRPLDSFGKYLLYILFFPKLIAGPIVRYHEIADQMDTQNRHVNSVSWLSGFVRFSVGLLKKVLIANNMGFVADQVFSMPAQELNSGLAWTGALAYAFQIYFDFSGYSDMAIGLGRIFGFRLPENFDYPYTSSSITEFWRRWHITLGKWMKNYLYIPLGGNKISPARTYFNLWLVFLFSGLWHGASWNFVVWGAYHGILLVAERTLVPRLRIKIPRYLSTVFTFFMVTIGWVVFRTEDLTTAAAFISEMFDFGSGDFLYLYSPHFIFYFLLATGFSYFRFFPGSEFLTQSFLFSHERERRLPWITLLSCLGFFLCICSLATFEFNPFIYFRF